MEKKHFSKMCYQVCELSCKFIQRNMPNEFNITYLNYFTLKTKQCVLKEKMDKNAEMK